MDFGLETLVVAVIVIMAAVYVGRAFLPRRKTPAGCASCPANPTRRDDYA